MAYEKIDDVMVFDDIEDLTNYLNEDLSRLDDEKIEKMVLNFKYSGLNDFDFDHHGGMATENMYHIYFRQKGDMGIWNEEKDCYEEPYLCIEVIVDEEKTIKGRFNYTVEPKEVSETCLIREAFFYTIEEYKNR